MPVLVVSHPHDRVATAVATRLVERGRTVVTTTASALVADAVTYRDDGGRRCWSTSVDGRTLASDDVAGILNRATHLQPLGFDDADERYAHAERAALLAAMFQVVSGPVLNRSNGATLAGPTPAPLQWLALAARHGLGVRGMTMTADGIDWAPLSDLVGAVTVVDGQVVDDPLSVTLTGHLRTGLGALAEALGCGLLQVRLGVDVSGELVVVDLDPLPGDLDPAALGRVVDVLAGGVAPDPPPVADVAHVEASEASGPGESLAAHGVAAP